MNHYEEKKQARTDRYRERADKNREKSAALHREFDSRTSAIPMGQPVLNDWDRNYREKAINLLRQSVQLEDKAAYYDSKADAAENNTAISSDDPEAVSKLESKIAEMEADHKEMINQNKYHRKHGTMKGYSGISDEDASKIDDRIKTAFSWERQPNPAWLLQNHNQKIKHYKNRLETLQKRETGFVGWEFEGGTAVANMEDNRLQLLFDEKPPDEQRAQLKANGFRWSSSNLAWQRQLNNDAIYAAGRLDFVKPLCGKRPSELQPTRPETKAKKEDPQR